MPTKTTCGGSVVWITEYEVREIDQHGDALNVNHFETLREAREFMHALALDSDLIAAAIEKHRSRHPSRGTPDTYETIATRGDAAALANWSGELATA